MNCLLLNCLLYVEIVLGVNRAMKEFEREQELAALSHRPKDDRVDDDF